MTTVATGEVLPEDSGRGGGVYLTEVGVRHWESTLDTLHIAPQRWVDPSGLSGLYIRCRPDGSGQRRYRAAADGATRHHRSPAPSVSRRPHRQRRAGQPQLRRRCPLLVSVTLTVNEVPGINRTPIGDSQRRPAVHRSVGQPRLVNDRAPARPASRPVHPRRQVDVTGSDMVSATPPGPAPHRGRPPGGDERSPAGSTPSIRRGVTVRAGRFKTLLNREGASWQMRRRSRSWPTFGYR
jgi:hypothetical protein